MAAVGAYLLRRHQLYTLAAVLLTVTVGLTLNLAGLDMQWWALSWALLAAAYFVSAVALQPVPGPSTPLLVISYGLAALAVAWSAYDASGAMARWTLPVVAVIAGTSAILLHLQRAPSLQRLVARSLVGWGYEGLSRQALAIGAAFFGTVAGVILPIWVGLMLLGWGVEGAAHAYNPLAWAFLAAVTSRFALRRLHKLYEGAGLALGAVLGVASIAILGLAYLQGLCTKTPLCTRSRRSAQ